MWGGVRGGCLRGRGSVGGGGGMDLRFKYIVGDKGVLERCPS